MTTLSRDRLGNRFIRKDHRHDRPHGGLGRHRRFPLRKTNRLLILIFMLVLFMLLLLGYLQV